MASSKEEAMKQVESVTVEKPENEGDGELNLKKILNNKIPVRIGLFGAAGAGKSSLINTLCSVLYGNPDSDSDSDDSDEDFLEVVHSAPDTHMGGHTLQRQPVKLCDTITIIDNRGWHKWTDEAVKEVEAQLEGRRSTTSKVRWEQVEEDSDVKIDHPISKKLTTAIVVIKGTDGIGGIEGGENLIHSCVEGTGQRPIAVVTHEDLLVKKQREALTSSLVTEYGISKSSIFFFRNITPSNTKLTPETKKSVKKLMKRCITASKQGQDHHDRRSEEWEQVKIIKRVEEENQIEVEDKERVKDIKELEKGKVQKELDIITRREEIVITERQNVEKEEEIRLEMLANEREENQKRIQIQTQKQKLLLDTTKKEEETKAEFLKSKMQTEQRMLDEEEKVKKQTLKEQKDSKMRQLQEDDMLQVELRAKAIEQEDIKTEMLRKQDKTKAALQKQEEEREEVKTDILRAEKAKKDKEVEMAELERLNKIQSNEKWLDNYDKFQLDAVRVKAEAKLKHGFTDL